MSTPTPIVVRDCDECPFAVGTTHPQCSHGTYAGTDRRFLPSETPEWCPLRTSPALVVLRPEGLQSPPLVTE